VKGVAAGAKDACGVRAATEGSLGIDAIRSRLLDVEIYLHFGFFTATEPALAAGDRFFKDQNR